MPDVHYTCETAASPSGRFGSGLTESEVRCFQTLLKSECGVDLPLPESWTRAIELLSLMEMLLTAKGAMGGGGELSTEFALPRS